MTISSCGHKVGSVSVVTAMVTVGLVAFCFLATPGWTRSSQTPCFMTQQAWQSRSVKPNSVPLSAIVFYGRRHHVRVLDKYLKQNLVSVGGLLQEVSWPTVSNFATCLASAFSSVAATFSGRIDLHCYKAQLPLHLLMPVPAGQQCMVRCRCFGLCTQRMLKIFTGSTKPCSPVSLSTTKLQPQAGFSWSVD